MPANNLAAAVQNYASQIANHFLEFRIVPYNKGRHDGPCCSRVAGIPDCNIAILEFDDQGLCFKRSAMDELQQLLDELQGRNPIIIVFAHGWKHSAAAGDDNLKAFEDILLSTTAEAGSRPVLGVYASWRGLSRDGNWFWLQSSFWDRHSAAQRVAQGSARELLGRLKAFRNGPVGASTEPAATLVVIGHSFGGLLIYTAIAQSLIEAAATQREAVATFGDLVLLVNPAFSAVSYLPVHEIVRHTTFDPNLLPVFVAVTATNDWATKYAYPAGTSPSLLTEAWRSPEERAALINTMGHLSWMRTHEITALAASPAPAAPPDAQEALFTTVRVRRLPGARPSPFWVASATPDVVDGHNGILLPNFQGFVRALVAAHIGKLAAAPQAAEAAAVAEAVPEIAAPAAPPPPVEAAPPPDESAPVEAATNDVAPPATPPRRPRKAVQAVSETSSPPADAAPDPSSNRTRRRTRRTNGEDAGPASPA